MLKCLREVVNRHKIEREEGGVGVMIDLNISTDKYSLICRKMRRIITFKA